MVTRATGGPWGSVGVAGPNPAPTQSEVDGQERSMTREALDGSAATVQVAPPSTVASTAGLPPVGVADPAGTPV